MVDLVIPPSSRNGTSSLLCCSSWGFRGFEYPAYFSAAARLGFKHIEIEMTRKVSSRCHIGPSAPNEELHMRRMEANRAGVTIVVLAGTNDFTVTNTDSLRDEISFARYQVDTAGALGAKVLRLFSGWVPYEHLSDLMYEQVSQSIHEVGEYAASLGLSVAIENHGGITGTAAQVKRLLDAVPLKNVGCTFDPANFVRSHEDPLSAYRVLADRVLYLQLKDLAWKQDGSEFCAIGEGVIGWKTLLPKISEMYEGYWGIEYEAAADVMEGTRRCLEALRGFGVIL